MELLWGEQGLKGFWGSTEGLRHFRNSLAFPTGKEITRNVKHQSKRPGTTSDH